MCGRFACFHSPIQLQQWYDASAMPDFPQRYNLAPGDDIVVIRSMPDGRAGSMMRWGFVPGWASDAAAIPMLHNARGETVAGRPMFRTAFRRRRCLVPASGFYEWKAVPGQKSKQPFYVSFKNGTPMSLAGIWDTAHAEDGRPFDSCAIITTQANAAVDPIHPRMPVIIDPCNWDAWLGNTPVEDDALAALLRPFDASRMQIWGVAHAVNRVKNDSAALIRPIA